MPTKRICPRCKLPYSYLERRQVGDRVYLYTVHESREHGKRRIKKCYLGPDKYRYVSKLHSPEGLVLRGLHDQDRVIDYLESLLQYLLEEKNSLKHLENITFMLRHVLAKLKK